MADFVEVLAKTARENINNGYYDISEAYEGAHLSLKSWIASSKIPAILAEIKPASPLKGQLQTEPDFVKIARDYARGGAVGISVLTEPVHFKGSLTALTDVRRAVKLPLLMKDIVIDPVQIDAAKKSGADAVLFIKTLFDRKLTKLGLAEMIREAQSRDLEVLLEVHDENEYSDALSTDADMIGINNRDLRTLELDLTTTKRLLAKFPKQRKIVISESGIETVKDIQFLKECGADAFLVGTTLMLAAEPYHKLRQLIGD